MTISDSTWRNGPARETPGRWSFSGVQESLLHRWLRQVRVGQLTVTFPSGRKQVFGGVDPGPNAQLAIRDTAVARKVALSGTVGFAESYIDGDWEASDLSAALTIFALNGRTMSDLGRRSWTVWGLNRLRHALRANTRAGSRRNVAAHYDLGNDFYRLWLDETMSYSSALFDDFAESHEGAQRRKYLRLAHTLRLRPGDHVLEIGCGWGGFAEIAASAFGCRVTAVTLSAEQAVFARARMVRAGLADKVEIRLQDYRDIGGTFDKVVSIEMFEAVGEANWPTYFDVLRRRLKPGGRAALQVISIAAAGFESYRRNPDFIQRHIFPGGMLPSRSAFAEAVSSAGLTVMDSFTFGQSYAETLRRWRAAFSANWPKIEALGFDHRFRLMWRYYFAYCEVGFALKLTDVGHYVIERP